MKPLVLVLAGVIIVLTSPLMVIAQHKAGTQGYHNQSAFAKLNYDSLFEAATPVSQSDEGQALFDAFLTAYGGKESLDGISSIRIKWKLNALMENDSVDVIRTFDLKNKHRFDLTHSDGRTESRFMVGDTVWSKTGDSVSVADRNRTILERFHYLSISLPMPIIESTISEIRYGTREGDTTGYFYIRFDDELIFSVGINSKTNFIVSSEGAVIDQDLRLVFVNLFSEPSLEQGFLAPHAYTFISMGLKVGQYRLVGLEVNPSLPDGYFRPRP